MVIVKALEKDLRKEQQKRLRQVRKLYIEFARRRHSIGHTEMDDAEPSNTDEAGPSDFRKRARQGDSDDDSIDLDSDVGSDD